MDNYYHTASYYNSFIVQMHFHIANRLWLTYRIVFGVSQTFGVLFLSVDVFVGLFHCLFPDFRCIWLAGLLPSTRLQCVAIF